MTTTVLTSELEAVNTLLGAVGESRINSLEVSGLADVAAAKDTLNEVSREVQARGWNFNTESDYPLNRDLTGRISLPANCLRAVFSRTHPDMQLAQRGLRLYDKTAHSFVFTKDLTAEVIFLLPWDELPQVARHFIMVRASRIYQARTLGSDTQFQFSAEEEEAAGAVLDEHEGDTGGHNMLTGSSSAIGIWSR